MSFVNDLLLVGLAACGYVIYRLHKRSRYPHRLFEVERALEMHADLALHRNHDQVSAQELRQLAEHLKRAQLQASQQAGNISDDLVEVKRALLYLTDEKMLTRIGLFYTDRCADIKAALYDLFSRLEKLAKHK